MMHCKAGGTGPHRPGQADGARQRRGPGLDQRPAAGLHQGRAAVQHHQRRLGQDVGWTAGRCEFQSTSQIANSIVL